MESIVYIKDHFKRVSFIRWQFKLKRIEGALQKLWLLGISHRANEWTEVYLIFMRVNRFYRWLMLSVCSISVNRKISDHVISKVICPEFIVQYYSLVFVLFGHYVCVYIFIYTNGQLQWFGIFAWKTIIFNQSELLNQISERKHWL